MITFEEGCQPCQSFLELGDGLYNRHECPHCSGVRAFCDNCCMDHHAGGWNSCESEGRKNCKHPLCVEAESKSVGGTVSTPESTGGKA
jgi:hypothetical protein